MKKVINMKRKTKVEKFTLRDIAKIFNVPYNLLEPKKGLRLSHYTEKRGKEFLKIVKFHMKGIKEKMETEDNY